MPSEGAEQGIICSFALRARRLTTAGRALHKVPGPPSYPGVESVSPLHHKRRPGSDAGNPAALPSALTRRGVSHAIRSRLHTHRARRGRRRAGHVLALAQGAHLDLVYVVKKGAPYVALNPEGSRVSARSRRCWRPNGQGLGLIPRGPRRQVPRARGGILCRRAHRCRGGVQGRADRRGCGQQRPLQALHGGQCGQRPAARLARAGGPAPRGDTSGRLR